MLSAAFRSVTRLRSADADSASPLPLETPFHGQFASQIAPSSAGFLRGCRAALAAGSAPQRYSLPSRHMAKRIIASLRATAVTARAWPLDLASFRPQALSVEKPWTRV